ncbi:hypothetical protein MY4824_000670 [Beauveria thailandica]
MHQWTLILAVTTATILASPQRRGDGGNFIQQTLGDAAAQCGNHQQISCCSKGNSAGTLLDGLLGGNCSPIDLSVIGAAITVSISTACSTQVACCTGDQNASKNLGKIELIDAGF